MNDDSAERQPLITCNATDGCWPPVFSHQQFSADEPLFSSCDPPKDRIRTSLSGPGRIIDLYAFDSNRKRQNAQLLTLETIVFVFHLLGATSKPFSSLSTRLAHAARLGFFLQKRAI